MAPESFSVRIFFQDGHVDGVKVVAKSKWPGRALVIPRSSVNAEKNRPELKAPGVYLLLGRAKGDEWSSIHVGAADPVCLALAEHESKSDFWNQVIVFAAKDNSLTLPHIQHIQARLIELAENPENIKLKPQGASKRSGLEDDELAYAESFLGHILNLCPVLGVNVFKTMPAAGNHDS